MSRKDPEGVEDRSKKERQDQLDQSTRDFLGLPKPNDKNPEGVPEGDKGHR